MLAALATGVAGLAASVPAPAASASIAPTLTLDQSAGTSAGATVQLGMDLKFAPSGGDSPKDLTLSLPAGLLANASIGGGACLQSVTPIAACQVGSGTVTAAGLGLLPVSLPVTFDLVAPPKPGDLAGLALMMTFLGNTSQLGTPGEITVRPPSDPRGVGLNIAFSNIPNTFSGASISVQELQNTLSGVRMPTNCPASPATVQVSADSYSDSTTRQTAGAPLQVTGCSKLPYTPTFHVRAVKDTQDGGTEIATDITQPSAPAQATSRTVKLAFPAAVLSPNSEAVLTGGILCADPASRTCKTIGTASSASPLYPTPLIGKAYLTGSLIEPAVTIVFPPPFALTLGGAVDLGTNTTTFTGLPDIPLTDLMVTLTGGSNAAFWASCSPPSGIATSTLTTQNGDRTVAVSAPFTVSGCASPSGSPTARSPHIGSASLSGLARGAPVLTFGLVAAGTGPKLNSFMVQAPHGLRFAPRLVHRGRTVSGVSVQGAEISSAVLARGRLVLTLRQPVRALRVRIRAPVLTESAGVEALAKRRRLGAEELTVVIRDSSRRSTTASVRITNVHP